jgi:hypothetical protein
MATEELAAMLIGMHPLLAFVEIRLDKPAALDGRARAACVEIKRTRDAFPSATRPTSYGFVESLLETRDASLSRIGIDAGKAMACALPPGTRMLEWVDEGDVSRDGQPLSPHAPLAPVEASATYRNTGANPAVLFRCICPPVVDV